MALAEATVRVVLDVSRFERELREKVQQAANRAGRDFDRAMRQQMATTARTATREFRNAAREGMVRAGRDASGGFDVAFRQGLSQTAGRAGQRLGQGLRVSVSRAGLEAGRGFASNVTNVLTASGESTGRNFINALRDGMTARAGTAGRAATQAIERNAVTGARQAGRRAGREFSLQFGIGSARAGRPVLLAIAALGAAVVTELRPTVGILAGIPTLLGAVAASAGVAAVAAMGMADAFDAVNSADVEGLGEAMERLAPAAQTVVREFSAVRPALQGLQQDIQNVFFSQLTGQVTRISDALTGELRDGILDVAEATGVMAREFVNAATSSRNLTNLNDLFRGTGALLDELRPGIANLTDGILDFAGQAAPGLRSMGNALSDLLTRIGQWMSEAARSGQALVWIEEGIQGFRDLGSTLGDLIQVLVSLSLALRPITFALSGLFDIMSLLASVFESLPGPVQTLALAFLLLTRTGIVSFFQSAAQGAVAMGTTIRGQFAQIGTAYQSTVGPLRTFTEQQRMLTQTVGQMPSVVSRAQGSFSNLGIAAAGAGAALRRGLGSAVSGLVGALGGPWGAAITGAVVALGFLASSQQEAQRTAAEHKAAVAELSDTLNRQTGAATAATRQLLTDRAAREGWLNIANQMGISSDQFVSALGGQEQALSAVESRLAALIDEQLRSHDTWDTLSSAAEEAGVSMEDLSLALAGNDAAQQRVNAASGRLGEKLRLAGGLALESSDDLRTLSGALNQTNTQLGEASAQSRQAAEAMDPAAMAAQRYADVLGILADETADADQKARALNEALNILAGGTINAEVAQGRFTELLARMDEQLADSTEGLQGMGAEMLTQSGRINTQTQAGAFLIDTYSQLSTQLSETAAQTVEAGRANGTLDQSLIQVAQQTQNARGQFIQTAQQLGLTESQANQLADAYGLIPAQVLTTVTDQGSAENTRLHVLGVYDQLKDLPPNTPVRVEGLTQEAIDKLNEVGVKTKTLPDGSVEVRAETQSAISSLQGLVNSWTGKVINFVANIVGGNAAGAILPKAKGGIVGYRDGGHHLTKMSANRAEIVPANTWRVIGDRAAGDEAYIPITKSTRSRALLDTTARRMGFELVPAGFGRRLESQLQGRAVQIDPGAIQIHAPYADPELVARATVNEIARYATT